MSKGFGRKERWIMRPALATYEDRLAHQSRKRTDTPVDKTLAWIAFYTAVFCAVSVFTPEVAIAAVCTVHAGVC